MRVESVSKYKVIGMFQNSNLPYLLSLELSRTQSAVSLSPRRRWSPQQGGWNTLSGEHLEILIDLLILLVCLNSKEKRAIEEFERKSKINGGRGTLRGWITLKKESEKNRRAALEDMKRAMDAVKIAEGNVIALGDRLEEDERKLQERATALRRKSCDLFKKVSDKDKERRALTIVIVDAVEQAEKAAFSEDGDLRFQQITSL